MAAITASMVAELRGKTDAPMMECKRALTEAEGDMAKAEELLRVKLGSKAGKAAGRITAEGVVTSFIDAGVGALLEVISAPAHGSSIILTLTPNAQAMTQARTSQANEVLT